MSEAIQLGTIVVLAEDRDLEAEFDKVRAYGFPTCQVTCTAEFMVDKLQPQRIVAAARNTGVTISSFFLLFEGQIFNRFDGPPVMGFIPEKYRTRRLDLARRFSDLVAQMDIKSITSHVGFIPDDPADPQYVSFLPVMRAFIEHCRSNNQRFCFETGQELPSTLMRTIRDLGLDNVGVNLDPANLILYGMAHPLDAVEILGEYVMGMHAKDALWPDRDEPLGEEVPVGAGAVKFPLLLDRLRRKGFRGPITIEREISGEQQTRDILAAKRYLEGLLR